MRIEKKGQDAALITPNETIDISNAHELKEDMLNLYNEGVNNITFDFSRVRSIDSSGLGKLLLFQKKLKERDGEMQIINISSDYVKKMFKMIHLDKVIKIQD